MIQGYKCIKIESYEINSGKIKILQYLKNDN